MKQHYFEKNAPFGHLMNAKEVFDMDNKADFNKKELAAMIQKFGLKKLPEELAKRGLKTETTYKNGKPVALRIYKHEKLVYFEDSKMLEEMHKEIRRLYSDKSKN